ncbi:MAG: hypothetical protein K2Y21_02170 [Phycisphaerales bacterium]|nr:hypothetical protein [Phycisphaerales bacterium]
MRIRDFASLATIGITASAVHATTFAYDNGTTTVAVGPPSSFPVNPVTGWGNYYMSDPVGTRITKLFAAFGPNFNPTTPVTMHLFADPDGDFNPLNAVLLTSVTKVPNQVGGSVFTTFDITPTVVNGGFFVMCTAVTVKGVDKPAAGDLTGRKDRSWYFYNPATSGMNLANLGANALAKRVDQVLPLPGAWLVRAEGEAVPAPGVLGMAGLLGLAALRRRR